MYEGNSYLYFGSYTGVAYDEFTIIKSWNTMDDIGGSGVIRGFRVKAFFKN